MTMFESLCVHDLCAYVSCLPGAHSGSLSYYGDSDGLEVDVIIELRDGRWAAIEIKLGEAKVPDGISNIKRLRRKVASNPAARNPAGVLRGGYSDLTFLPLRCGERRLCLPHHSAAAVRLCSFRALLAALESRQPARQPLARCCAADIASGMVAIRWQDVTPIKAKQTFSSFLINRHKTSIICVQ